MNVLIVEDISSAKSLPAEAAPWLESRRAGIRHEFECRTEAARKDAGSFFRLLKDGGGEVDYDLAQKTLSGNALESCIILDGLYPFVSPHDLMRLWQECRNHNAFSLLRAHGGQIAAVAFDKNSRGNSVGGGLPEFRSIRVDSLTSWMIAQKIHENWPLFYFNASYTDYWRQRTTTANSEADKTATEDIFFDFFNRALRYMAGGKKLLDAGCGHGRFFSMFEEQGFDVLGVDISWDAISLCGIKNYNVSHGTCEDTGAPESMFGFVNAWAVFDSADQNKALHHLLGRLALGGVLLLSGKNDSYRPDDRLAREAERNAALKLFPNGFTDFALFEKAVAAYGGKIVEAYYGERRGDMAKNAMRIEKPDFFYEWVVIIKKQAQTPATLNNQRLSQPHSRNFHPGQGDFPCAA